jgi:hypothetical protein
MYTTARRQLKFSSVDEIVPDLDRLMAGHQTVGKWTLGEICNHLSKVFIGSVDGFANKAPLLLRVTIAPFIFRHILKTEQMAEGFNTPAEMMPGPGLDDRAEVEALRAAVRLYLANPNPVAEHPFFGKIGRNGWDRLHRIHCAHHLSFALLKQT